MMPFGTNQLAQARDANWDKFPVCQLGHLEGRRGSHFAAMGLGLEM